MRRVLAGLLVGPLLAAGCATGTTPADSGIPSVLPSVSTDPAVLPAGKGDLPVQGVEFSPRDFVPMLRLTVPKGWVSTHRGDDAFDLSRPAPGKDAPEVVVAFVTPTDATAAAALSTLRARLGPVKDASGTISGVRVSGIDVTGGTGTLLESPGGTLSLDRAPGQQARILAVDLQDVPLLVVVVVPDAARFEELLPMVDELFNGVAPG